jgi:hypothetical protein
VREQLAAEPAATEKTVFGGPFDMAGRPMKRWILAKG